MKKSLSLYFGLLFCISSCTIIFYGCKKKEKETEIILPDHCSDGIINDGELDTDCGGSCPACAAIIPPCSNTNNVAKLAGFPDLVITYVTCQIQYGNFTMVGNSSNGDIIITLSGATPTVDRAYSFVSGGGSIMAEGQAHVQMSKGFSGSFYASNGKAYVAIKNGKIEVTFCNIIFKGDQTPGDFLGNGKVACQ